MTREELLPRELQAQLPRIGTTHSISELTAEVKFFSPDLGWRWYVIEFDGEDTCFGMVDGDVITLGYFRLSELLEYPVMYGCTIERDDCFTPKPVHRLMLV